MTHWYVQALGVIALAGALWLALVWLEWHLTRGRDR